MANVPGHPARARHLPLTALPPGTKVVVGIGWLLVIGAWAAVLALAGSTSSVGASLLIFLAVLALLTIVPLTFVLAEAFRYRAWLEGTTLAVRHVGGTRRCDLGRSAVTLKRSRLTARDGVTGQRVRLTVSRTGLGPQKLSALADAVGRGPDPASQRAAAALREQAGSLAGGRPG
jgi:hypothetical protein